MRDARSRTKVCEQARELSSRRLDGELSPFEEARLDGHLEACPGCRAFERDLAAVVANLRATPLEQPDRLITLPERRRRFTPAARVGAVAAAAVAAIAALVPSLVGVHSARSQQRARVAAAIAAANNQDVQLLHLIRNAQAPRAARAFLISHGRGPRPT